MDTQSGPRIGEHAARRRENPLAVEVEGNVAPAHGGEVGAGQGDALRPECRNGVDARREPIELSLAHAGAPVAQVRDDPEVRPEVAQVDAGRVYGRGLDLSRPYVAKRQAG